MTTDNREQQQQSNRHKGYAQLWPLLLPVLGICLLAFCLVSGAVVVWQFRTHDRSTDLSVATTLEETPTPSLSDQMQPSPTPPQAQSETLTTAPPLDETPQVEPTSQPHVCNENPLTHSQPITTPLVGPISFAAQPDQAMQFTTAITRLQASFGFMGMQNGLPWERVWYYGEQTLSRSSGSWDAGQRGELTLFVEAGEEGFTPGRYQLEILVDGQSVSRNSFAVLTVDTPTQRPVQVAYTTWNGQAHQITMLNLETQTTERLLDVARSPSWASNAKGLLFYAEPGFTAGTPGLWVLSLDSGEPVQLNDGHPFQSLAWSPVGDVVASSLVGADGPNLTLWQLAGQKPVQIGPPGEGPAWSPQGRRLAFRSCDEDGWHLSTIQVVRDQFDPTSQRRLTEGDGRQPAWSRDGQRIAFVQPTADGADDIFVIDADGQNLRRLTNHPGPDTAPAWTPDNRIIFHAYRDESWGLYTMAADGSKQQLLVETQADPAWQPEPVAVSTDLLFVEPQAPKPQIAVPAGQGLLVVSNRRNPDEMTFTIHNQEHKIGPYQTRNLPLPPGRHTWTASWPGKVSRNGIADIVIGQIAHPIVER